MLVTSFGVWVSLIRSPSKRNRTLPLFNYISTICYALPLAICVHQFLEYGGFLDLEEHFLAVLNDFRWYLRLDLEVEEVRVGVGSSGVSGHGQFF